MNLKEKYIFAAFLKVLILRQNNMMLEYWLGNNDPNFYLFPACYCDQLLKVMGNLVKRCRSGRTDEDRELEARRSEISKTLNARIAASGGSLPRRRRHLTTALETIIAGILSFLANVYFLIGKTTKIRQF